MITKIYQSIHIVCYLEVPVALEVLPIAVGITVILPSLSPFPALEVLTFPNGTTIKSKNNNLLLHLESLTLIDQ